MNKICQKLIVLLILLLLTSCSIFSNNEQESNQKEQPKKDPPIARYEGEMSPVIPYVYTTKKELTITFNGLGDKERIEQILDELDKYNIKATFFVPGIRTAEEPDVVREIIKRGHEIGNNTLNQVELNNLPYEEMYKEIKIANEVIEEKTGVKPRYVRTKSGDYNDEVRLAAAHAGLEGVVYYSVNPQDWDMKSAEEIAEYVSRFITRGGIITLNTDKNPEVVKAIPLIAKAVERVGYQFVSLHELVSHGGVRKPLEEIAGYDAAQYNKNIQDVEYEIIEKMDTNKKEIALTFDDWGTDYKMTQILDILDKYGVKATFFLRMNGVESNPNLARAIVDEGHEVANHTYSHPVITKLSLEELQEELVKAHQVLTEAIQEQPPMIFRPPTGEIDERTAKIVAATGYKSIILYDVTTFDWDSNVSAEQIISKILEETENGSIILLHLQEDIHTAEALPTVIEKLQAKGYKFVKITDWLK